MKAVSWVNLTSFANGKKHVEKCVWTSGVLEGGMGPQICESRALLVLFEEPKKTRGMAQ